MGISKLLSQDRTSTTKTSVGGTKGWEGREILRYREAVEAGEHVRVKSEEFYRTDVFATGPPSLALPRLRLGQTVEC